MIPAGRHQCLIYDGAPSRQLPAIASIIRQKLSERFRCLYLNSWPMVAGIKSYLAAEGVDIEKETAAGNLVLSSERQHLLNDWEFNVDRMIDMLGRTLDQALKDGHQGLWASGDMTWEFGPARDLSRLLEYEWRLEEFFRQHPQIQGIRQYHADTLPRHILRTGLIAHSTLFISETLTVINPSFLPREETTEAAITDPKLDHAIDRVLSRESLT